MKEMNTLQVFYKKQGLEGLRMENEVYMEKNKFAIAKTI